jgi:hypothetical protein
MAIVYFYAGVAKLTSDDWLRGRPMDTFLSTATDFPVIGRWFDEQWLVYVASYAGMLFDLLVVPLLLWPRTRTPTLLVAIGFHVTNSRIFEIQVFPWLALAATLLFLPPPWPRSLLRFARKSFPQPVSASPPHPRLSLSGKVVAAVLGVYFLLQLTLPLRHYLYAGDVSWTAEGNFFAWRMLTTERSGAVVFYLRSKTADATCEVNTRSYLYSFQTPLLHIPDMIVQAAHHIAAEYRERGADVAVHAWTDVSLNGHPYRLFVDPEVDLASVDRTLGHYEWVQDRNDPMRLDRPVALPCPDPIPPERVREIREAEPRVD